MLNKNDGSFFSSCESSQSLLPPKLLPSVPHSLSVLYCRLFNPMHAQLYVYTSIYVIYTSIYSTQLYAYISIDRGAKDTNFWLLQSWQCFGDPCAAWSLFGHLICPLHKLGCHHECSFQLDQASNTVLWTAVFKQKLQLFVWFDFPSLYKNMDYRKDLRHQKAVKTLIIFIRSHGLETPNSSYFNVFWWAKPEVCYFISSLLFKEPYLLSTNYLVISSASFINDNKCPLCCLFG